MTRLFGLDILSTTVRIPAGDIELEGLLCIPDGARAIVAFAQGRGSSRTNAVDTYLAAELQHHGVATLLLDMYTPSELDEDTQDAHLRFNVRMLGDRLTAVADWLMNNPSTHHMVAGLMGASTGAAAALIAAGNRPEAINVIVCWAGRPDLAGDALRYVHSPTLLLVGENDHLVYSLNEFAIDQMTHVRKLIPVANAGHEFQELGALEHLADQACQWFNTYLTPNRAM